MTKDQLVDFVEHHCNVRHNDAVRFVNDCLSYGYTWLDIIRKIEFSMKSDQYSRAMQFA